MPILISDFDKAVQLISHIRSNHSSLYGLRYRSVICTIVRHDPHLLEFILRHLISGFSHIVIYDNNRIKAGHDINITNLLEPFIAAGVVTHIPWHQESAEQLPNDDKNGRSWECLNKYGANADWVAIFDTDEYFYYEKQNSSVNTLNDLLLELEQQSFCAITILWTPMYGEAAILKKNSTLLESYPRVCRIYNIHKILFRPKLTHIIMPHIAWCNSSNYTARTRVSDNNSKIALVHYYSKSIEEFLTKADQSIPPFIRRPIATYIDSGGICSLVNFVYSEDYRRTFMNVYKQFEMLHSFKPITLLPSPVLNIKYISVRDHADYALFLYLKYRCVKRQEFDHDRYLSINPDAKQAIKDGTVTDGLHHYMMHFSKGVKGCWKTDNYSICE